MNRTPRLLLLAAVGDAIILVGFAAVGRASHRDSGGGVLLGTLGTAAPFLVGWFVAAAVALRLSPNPFLRLAVALRVTALTWIAGGVIGLAIRSVIERRVVPLPFAVVTLSFNLFWLVLWHGTLAALGRKKG